MAICVFTFHRTDREKRESLHSCTLVVLREGSDTQNRLSERKCDRSTVGTRVSSSGEMLQAFRKKVRDWQRVSMS